METKDFIQEAMHKCAVAYNSKDINAWADSKTYSQMAQEIALHLHSNGISLQKYNKAMEMLTDNETELTTNDGE
jgi:hypothetical protein